MKLGIVNDMPQALEALRRTVALDTRLRVLWTADNGAEAVALCERQRPDLILMDLVMAGMDGVETTRLIMSRSPCPILIVTATIEEQVSRVYDALGHGALDVVATPSPGPDGELKGSGDLLRKIRMALGLRHRPGRRQAAPASRPSPADRHPADRLPLVAIGASTGGPNALGTLLAALPANLPAAVLVVQHLDTQFTPGLAAWLGRRSKLPVHALTKAGDPLPGNVYVAAGDGHLVIDTLRRLRFVAEPSQHAHRPSIDALFHSIALHAGARDCGVLLTGMGRDGAEGLLAMQRAGCLTIAQDQASSIVWGIPGAAVRLGAAGAVLPLQDIAPAVVHHVTHPPAQSAAEPLPS